MVRGKILSAILSQRDQKVKKDLGLKIFSKEAEKNDTEGESFQTERN